MPNLTTPIPPKLTGNSQTDIEKIKEWGTALIDELSYILNNLGSENVIEASSVKAENIDTKNARIENAQIGSMSADKLTAGTIDTDKVTLSTQDEALVLSSSELLMSDGNKVRMYAGYDNESEEFNFMICNRKGKPTVAIDDKGDGVFTGKVESSSVYSSSIVGTDSQSYEDVDGGVFAQLDPTGIKMMQDNDGERLQKFGVSVADDGTSYLVMGEGDGTGSVNINGVIYTDGTFKLEKNDKYAHMGLVGYSPFITFWQDIDELWLSGNKIKINGVNVNKKIEIMEEDITYLLDKVSALENAINGG